MVGHGLMMWAHHYVDVTVTSMMTLANPVVSIVGAWIIYDQDLAPAQMVGGVVVLVALGAILRRQRSERAPRRRSRAHRRPPRRIASCVTDRDTTRVTQPGAGWRQRRSMMVTLAWPPPSHMVWRP